MQAFFEWLFADFWRFLMFMVLLIIAVQWRPVEIHTTTYEGDNKDVPE